MFSSIHFSSVALCHPMDCSPPGFPVHQLLEFTQTHVHWVTDPSNRLILCRPLLLLPSVFPRIRVFSSESVLCTCVMLCSLIYSKFINSFTLKPTIILGITWLWHSMQHVRLKALLHCTHSCDHSLDFVSWSSTTSESYTPVYHCCPGMADIQRGRGLFLCLHVRRQTDQMNLVWFFLRFRELTAILWLP